MNLNIFKKNKEIKGSEIISLTFKMPILNFLNYFKFNHNWEVRFSDEELNKIEQAIKKIKKGKPQDLVFEDDFKNLIKLEGGKKIDK